MRTIQSLALSLAVLGPVGLAFPQDPVFDTPCDHNLDPVVERGVSFESPTVVPPSDPRTANDLRAFENARPEGRREGGHAATSSYSGLPGADDEDVAGDSSNDPLKRAEENRSKKEADAAAAQRERDDAKKALDAYRMQSPTGDDSAEYARLCNDFSLLAGIAIAARQAADKARKEEEALRKQYEEEQERLAAEKARQDAEEARKKAEEEARKKADDAKKATDEAAKRRREEAARAKTEEEERARLAREKKEAERTAEDLARWLRALRDAGRGAEADRLERDILDALSAAQTGVETSLDTLRGVLGGQSFATSLSAALLPAAYGTFVVIVGRHIQAAGQRIADRMEADLESQKYDSVIDGMRRDGASTYCARHSDGSAVFIQKNTDRQPGERPYVITVLTSGGGIYTYR